MKNFEKYKTVHDAWKAWNIFCSNTVCGGACPYFEGKPSPSCHFKWLYAEAESNKDINNTNNKATHA